MNEVQKFEGGQTYNREAVAEETKETVRDLLEERLGGPIELVSPEKRVEVISALLIEIGERCDQKERHLPDPLAVLLDFPKAEMALAAVTARANAVLN